MDLPYEQIILFTLNKAGQVGTVSLSKKITTIAIKMNEHKGFTQSQFFTCLLKEEGYYYWYLGLGNPKP